MPGHYSFIDLPTQGNSAIHSSIIQASTHQLFICSSINPATHLAVCPPTHLGCVSTHPAISPIVDHPTHVEAIFPFVCPPTFEPAQDLYSPASIPRASLPSPQPSPCPPVRARSLTIRCELGLWRGPRDSVEEGRMGCWLVFCQCDTGWCLSGRGTSVDTVPPPVRPPSKAVSHFLTGVGDSVHHESILRQVAKSFLRRQAGQV